MSFFVVVKYDPESK